MPARTSPGFAIVLLAAILSFAAAPAAADERGAAQQLERISSSPSKLRNFLHRMPKGTDLHTHLSGAVYAESMIGWGAEDGRCVNTETMVSSYPPCLPGQRPMSDALTDTRFYDDIIAAWSMRNFIPGPESGHDHFFATFDLFGAAFGGRQGDGLAEVTNRAGSQNVQYVEPLITPQFGATSAIGRTVGYNRDFAAMRQQMLEAGLLDALPAASLTASSALERKDELQDCFGAKPQPGCYVDVGFDVQVLRNNQPAVVFAQLLFGFELMAADPNWVGMNMVQPEDSPLATRYYRLHMKMIRFLKRQYPRGKVTLHAGELVPGLVPPEDLRFHVRHAVDVAGADRIGHGADLRWERNPKALLRSIKRKRVCVEINLTSNAQILGLQGRRHPIGDYVGAGTRVTLSTDDEGVSRTDLTAQYVRAVRRQGFGYRQLKRFAETGLRCSFLPSGRK
ncbi:MAG: adenosine deaminase, partial [Actinomycetota bacterium]|nr:adenosine deaminase [Actinomycetota bacterium]